MSASANTKLKGRGTHIELDPRALIEPLFIADPFDASLADSRLGQNLTQAGSPGRSRSSSGEPTPAPGVWSAAAIGRLVAVPPGHTRVTPVTGV